jgi:F-type H+-transporting ATPase subunit delta
MSSKVTVARPYAKAVYISADSENSFKKWFDFLDFFCKVLEDSRAITFLKNPTESSQSKADFLINVCSFYEKESCFKNFIKVLSLKNRLFYASEIRTLFKELVYFKNETMDVLVATAASLGKDEQQKLLSTLTEKFNKKIYISFHVRPVLIGGVLIKAGNKIFDRTIKGSLNSLRSFLLNC